MQQTETIISNNNLHTLNIYMHKIVTNNSHVVITVFQYGLRSLMLVLQESVIYKWLVDRLFNMNVVIFRRIITSKIGTKLVATRMRFLGSKYAKNAFVATGELTALLQTP